MAATLVVAVAFTVGSLALLWALGASLRDAAENAAETRAEEIATAIERDGAEAVPGTASDDEDVADLAWQVTRDSSVVASAGTGGRSLPLGDGRVRLDGDPYVVVVEDVEVDGERYLVAAAASLDDADESVAALWPLLAVGIPAAVLLVAGTTWVVAGRALRPVEQIRARVAGIGAGALDQRVPVPPSGDEVARLALTMNAMLERLEQASRRQAQFVSDTSHELRSPLASIRQTAEVARLHPGAMDDGELSEAVLEETARMQHLVEQMLVLARTEESAAARPRSDVDVDDLLQTEAARLRRERGDLRVDSSAVGAARATADGPALAQVVRNLADNAARHAVGEVRLGCRELPGGVEITVDDDGAGVAPQDRDRVFERFVRLDEARSRDVGGSGLGLAIVREVARAHGGDARVETSPAGGARFVVSLATGVPHPPHGPSHGPAHPS
ncbi:HAMP domain-containing sensor histidine kinase [Nocardioides zeae]|uniref:histidine kinase n=1 Tax=Nocardioides imazamoxiresistens TaxID=3231893 RepID=A0ABU3PZA5_9ACTN|nr:HAMP domain-containing sensor histidine kinase [Nocardioides zeae]MDT9594590.1 HAMP domain-containing sensor histidine kinase [Nocardioides zeae]